MRDELISLRNGNTYVTNFVTLSLTLLIYATVSNQVNQFRIICLAILIPGIAVTIYFLIVVNEVKLGREAKYFEEDYKKT